MANRRLIPVEEEETLPRRTAALPAERASAQPARPAPAAPPLPGAPGAPSAPNVPYSPAPPGTPAEPVTRGTGLLSQIDAAGRGIADAATLGMMDELSAYLGSLTGIGGKRGDYAGNLATQRGVDTFDKDAMPVARGAGQVAGGVATALALPSLAAKYAGASVVPRVAAGAAEGAAYGGAYGFGSGEGGFENRLKQGISEAPTGALIGGAAGAAAPLVARGVDRLLGRGAVDPLVEARQAISATIGVPVDQVPDEMARRWAGSVARSTEAQPVATARTMAADEFGIPLTRGQATGDVGAQAFEEAARNNARGPAAGAVVRGFDTRQTGAVDDAATNIARGVAGADELATRNPLALSEQVLNDLRAAEQASGRGVNEAYDAARDAGASVRTEALAGAPQSIRRYLDEARIIVNDTLTPYTSRALSEIDDFSRLGSVLENRTATLPGGAGDRVAGVALDGIEKQRSQLLAARRAASDPTDQRAIGQLIRGFDDWLDDAGRNGLLDGTEEGLELFKRARSARREHGARFESNPRQIDDDAGKIIEKMIDKDVQPGEVANALLGAARVGEKGSSVRLAQRLRTILGADSPEFGAVKQAAWEKLIRNDQGDLLGPQAMASTLRRFTSQGGEAFANTLYSASEIGKMRRLAGVLQSITTDSRATNRGQSGYEISRLIQDVFGAGGFGLAALGAGASPTLSIGAALVGGLGRNAVQGGRAVNATRAAPRSAASARPVERAVAGAGRGAIAAGQDDNEPLTVTVRPRRRAE